MKYMLLIYHDEVAWNALSESERQLLYKEYRELREQLQSRGQYLDGSQLQASTVATSVRVRNGEELVTDGPFAETHEQLGGYFLVDVENLDRAIEVAKQIPSSRTGTIEVRPLAEAAKATS